MSFQDFSMDFGHCPEITVYTGCCLFPAANQLSTLWAENKKALLSMLVEVGFYYHYDFQPFCMKMFCFALGFLDLQETIFFYIPDFVNAMLMYVTHLLVIYFWIRM